MKKTISVILIVMLIISSLVLPASAEQNSRRSISELIQAIPGSDGAISEGLYYNLFKNFTDDPNAFIAELDAQDSATRTMLIEQLSLYCVSDLRVKFEESLSKLEPSETAEALTNFFDSVKDTYQENIRTDIYMPEYDPSTIKQFVEANKANGFVYDEEYYTLLTKVYNADTNVFAKAVLGLTGSDMNKVALGMTVSAAKSEVELKADFSKGGTLSATETTKMTAFETALSASETTAISESALKEAAIKTFNADVVSENAEVVEDDQVSLMAATPTIGAIGWSYLKVGSASTRLNVTINDPANSSSMRSYYIRVYCYSYGNGQWWLKNSGYYVMLGAGVSSMLAQVPVSFSSAGTILTKVEIWNSSNSSMLTSLQKSGSDVVKGDWRINVDLPTNRYREGALGVYNASGVMVLPIIRCLGRSVSEASMGTTNGNTPVGNNYGVLYPASSDTDAYGPYKRVLLTAMPGHPYSNRTEIMIHGGRSQTALQPTHGCIRVFNSDQLLIQNKLETLMLPANGHNSTGTVIVSEQSYLD